MTKKELNKMIINKKIYVKYDDGREEVLVKTFQETVDFVDLYGDRTKGLTIIKVETIKEPKVELDNIDFYESMCNGMLY